MVGKKEDVVVPSYKVLDQLFGLCDALDILVKDLSMQVASLRATAIKVQSTKTEILKKLREI